MQYCREVFRTGYPNPKEAEWKLNRQLLAHHYLNQHADAFEKSGWLLASGKTLATTGELTFALYLFFGRVTDVQVKNPPMPKEFEKAAIDTQRQWKKVGTR